MVNDGNEIIISFDELHSEEVDRRVEELQKAGQTQLIKEVGDATTRSRWTQHPLVQGLGLGVVAGLLAAIGTELIAQPGSEHRWYGQNVYVATILLFGIFALLFTIPFTLLEGIQARNKDRMLKDLGFGVAVVIGPSMVAAIVAQFAYSRLVGSFVLSDPWSINFTALHFVRGFAWSVVAVGAGVGLGLTKKSVRPVVNGALGGFIGGYAGGAIFDFLHGSMARIVGLTIIGMLIGFSIGLVNEITKQHWIEIVSGGMAGKQFILYLPRTVIGSSASADITLIKDPHLDLEHVALVSQGKGLLVSNISHSAPVHVNGVVTSNHTLVDGDLIQLGSTILRYRSKAEQLPTWK